MASFNASEMASFNSLLSVLVLFSTIKYRVWTPAPGISSLLTSLSLLVVLCGVHRRAARLGPGLGVLRYARNTAGATAEGEMCGPADRAASFR